MDKLTQAQLELKVAQLKLKVAELTEERDKAELRVAQTAVEAEEVLRGIDEDRAELARLRADLDAIGKIVNPRTTGTVTVSIKPSMFTTTVSNTSTTPETLEQLRKLAENIQPPRKYRS
jgi:hypothetical protein